MTDRNIVLASPNNTSVFRGEYVLIDLNRADTSDVLEIAELPDRTSLSIGDTGGSEVRWASSRTLIYRAPTKASGDRFKVRRGDGVHQQYIRVDHVKSQSTPADQARLKAIFDAALPTIRIDGRGVSSGGGGSGEARALQAKIDAAIAALR